LTMPTISPPPYARARLVEVDTPTHLLWLGEGSDRTAAEIGHFTA
jgi:hypothetical protein